MLLNVMSQSSAAGRKQTRLRASARSMHGIRDLQQPVPPSRGSANWFLITLRPVNRIACASGSKCKTAANV